MKRTVRIAPVCAVTLLLVAAAGLVAVPAQRPARPRPAPGPFPAAPKAARASATLANGVAIVAERHDGVPLVSVSLVARVGWGDAFDYSQASRAAAVLGAQLERQASSIEAGTIGPVLRGLGASVSATAEDATLTTAARAPAPSLDGLMASLAQLVQSPARDGDLEVAAAQVDQQRGRASQVPWVRAEQEVRGLLFGARPGASAPAAGPQPGVAPRTGVALRPHETVVLIVGAIDPALAVGIGARCFASWAAPGVTPVESRDLLPRPADRVVFIDRPGSEQATIAIGLEGPPVGDPSGAVFEVLNGVYGGYTDSRLFRLLVQEKGWAYGPLSQVRAALGRTYFLARADSRNETAPEVAREMVALLDDLAGSPVPEAEVKAAATYLAGALLLQRATAAGRLAQLTSATRIGVTLDDLDAAPGRLFSVNARALQAVARELAAANRRVIVIQGSHAQLGRRLSFLGEMRVVGAGSRSDASTRLR